MRVVTPLAIVLVLPTWLSAAGFNDDDPPKPTPTTQSCEKGRIWDEKTKECVDPNQSHLEDDSRMRAVRELAYADRIEEAVAVLETITNQSADGVLTYRGFTARKSGDAEAATEWYQAALRANPDNHLARSYMGQGFVAAGDLTAARAQLSEIRARGGRGTWAEVSLRLSIGSGRGYSY